MGRLRHAGEAVGPGLGDFPWCLGSVPWMLSSPSSALTLGCSRCFQACDLAKGRPPRAAVRVEGAGSQVPGAALWLPVLPARGLRSPTRRVQWVVEFYCRRHCKGRGSS